MPLSNNSQSPLSSALSRPLLPPDKYYNKHPNKYFNERNSNIDYLNNKLNSDAIKALWPSSNKPSSFTRD